MTRVFWQGGMADEIRILAHQRHLISRNLLHEQSLALRACDSTQLSSSGSAHRASTRKAESTHITDYLLRADILAAAVT